MSDSITPVAIDLGEVVGPPGQTGANGTNGTNFRYGAGAPESSVGSDGDTYLDVNGLNFYSKTNGAWMLVSSPFAAAISSAIATSLAPEETVFDLSQNPPTSEGAGGSTVSRTDTAAFFTGDNSRIVAVRSGRVVTFWAYAAPEDHASSGQYSYHSATGQQDGVDRHNFGAILPDGMRPKETFWTICYATAADGNLYWGRGQVQPNGAFGTERLIKEGDTSVSTTLTLKGFKLSATFIAADPEEQTEEEEAEETT